MSLRGCSEDLLEPPTKRKRGAFSLEDLDESIFLQSIIPFLHPFHDLKNVSSVNKAFHHNVANKLAVMKQLRTFYNSNEIFTFETCSNLLHGLKIHSISLAAGKQTFFLFQSILKFRGQELKRGLEAFDRVMTCPSQPMMGRVIGFLIDKNVPEQDRTVVTTYFQNYLQRDKRFKTRGFFQLSEQQLQDFDQFWIDRLGPIPDEETRELISKVEGIIRQFGYEHNDLIQKFATKSFSVVPQHLLEIGVEYGYNVNAANVLVVDDIHPRVFNHLGFFTFRGNLPRVNELLQMEDVDVNAILDAPHPCQRLSPLKISVQENQQPIFNRLLECPNIDVNRKSVSATALHDAIFLDDEEGCVFVEKLLQFEGIDVNATFGTAKWTPLLLAAMLEETQNIPSLLADPRVNVNAQACTGMTFLMMLVCKSRADLVQTILQRQDVHSYDLSLADDHGHMILWWAIKYLHNQTAQQGLGLIKSLVSNGAQPFDGMVDCFQLKIAEIEAGNTDDPQKLIQVEELRAEGTTILTNLLEASTIS